MTSPVQFPELHQGPSEGAQGVQDEARFTTSEVARIADVTLRQLQWWDEQHLLSPVQDGHSRMYQRREVFLALLIAELRERKFSLQKVRRLVVAIKAQGFTMPTDARYFLVAAKTRVAFLAHDAPVLEFLAERKNGKCELLNLAALAARIPVALGKPKRRPMARAFSVREFRAELREHLERKVSA